LHVELLQDLNRQRVAAGIDERNGALSLCGLGRIAADGVEQDIGIEGSAASFAAPVRVLPRQATTGGELADLGTQIALLALEAALWAVLGYPPRHESV
jgi:hypothetical protein